MDPNFPRAPAALREGLHAAFGFPIRLGPEILGVIEFFSQEIREPDAALLAKPVGPEALIHAIARLVNPP